MTGRVVRLELRRSTARWLALLPLPLVLLAVGEAGRGLSVIVFDQRQLLTLASALALGIAAWQARRERRSRLVELLATTPRPRWQRVLPTAAALAAGAAGGYLALYAGLGGYVAAAGGHVSPTTAPTAAVGALVLVVPVAWGLVLGRWLPFLAVPPLALVYLVAAVALSDTEAYGDPPGTLLLWGGVEAHSRMASEFAAVTARTHVAQAVWALALTAAALVVFAATRPRTAALAVVPVAVGVAVALPLLPGRYADAVYADHRATALTCTADAPVVCVTRAHHLALPELTAAGREALAVLAARLPAGPDALPGKVVEANLRKDAGAWSVDAPVPRPAGTLYVETRVDGMGRADGSRRDLLWSSLMGAGTLVCDDAPPWPSAARQRHDAARLVAAAWLLDEPPLSPAENPGVWDWLPERSVTMPAYQALRALPAAEQRARVSALRAAELSCAPGDRLTILTGRGSV